MCDGGRRYHARVALGVGEGLFTKLQPVAFIDGFKSSHFESIATASTSAQ